MIKCHDPKVVHQSTKEIAATWLAVGLDPDNVTFYRQSDIPEISQLCWYLTCLAPKGLMNRAHAYKDAVKKNIDAEEDNDFAVTMGLFSYPILMAADILMFNATKVPVGKDQIQHIEMARDIAQRFNYLYGKQFTLPEAIVDDQVSILKGVDGRKMSKTYGNTIPLFLAEKQLKKQINKIKTNLLEPGEPKDTETSIIFQIWKAFASKDQINYMRKEYENGIAWGEAKKQLFELINEELKNPRNLYNQLLESPDYIESVLCEGSKKARNHSSKFLEKINKSIGLKSLEISS
jgi:tryptophanyl-tRNA synthetase